MKRHATKFAAFAIAAGTLLGCTGKETAVTSQKKSNWSEASSEAITSAVPEEQKAISARTFFAAGHLYESQGALTSAVVQYREALRLDPRHVGALNRLGRVYGRLGRHEEAALMFLRGIEIQPDSALMRNNLGFAYVMQKRWGDAETEFRNAVALKPDFGRAQINLGMVLGRQERFDEALQAFLAVLPEADAYYNLGLILRGKQRFSEAAAAFQLALDINPKFAAADTQLEELEPRLALMRSIAPEAAAVNWQALTGESDAAAAEQPAIAQAEAAPAPIQQAMPSVEEPRAAVAPNDVAHKVIVLAPDVTSEQSENIEQPQVNEIETVVEQETPVAAEPAVGETETAPAAPVVAGDAMETPAVERIAIDEVAAEDVMIEDATIEDDQEDADRIEILATEVVEPAPAVTEAKPESNIDELDVTDAEPMQPVVDRFEFAESPVEDMAMSEAEPLDDVVEPVSELVEIEPVTVEASEPIVQLADADLPIDETNGAAQAVAEVTIPQAEEEEIAVTAKPEPVAVEPVVVETEMVSQEQVADAALEPSASPIDEPFVEDVLAERPCDGDGDDLADFAVSLLATWRSEADLASQADAPVEIEHSVEQPPALEAEIMADTLTAAIAEGPVVPVNEATMGEPEWMVVAELGDDEEDVASGNDVPAPPTDQVAIADDVKMEVTEDVDAQPVVAAAPREAVVAQPTAYPEIAYPDLPEVPAVLESHAAANVETAVVEMRPAAPIQPMDEILEPGLVIEDLSNSDLHWLTFGTAPQKTEFAPLDPTMRDSLSDFGAPLALDRPGPDNAWRMFVGTPTADALAMSDRSMAEVSLAGLVDDVIDSWSTTAMPQMLGGDRSIEMLTLDDSPRTTAGTDAPNVVAPTVRAAPIRNYKVLAAELLPVSDDPGFVPQPAGSFGRLR